MTRGWVKFLIAMISLAMGSCVMAPVVTGPPPGVKVKRGVVFSPDGWPKRMRADLWRPAGPVERQPGVLMLHGGGLHGGGGRWQMDGIAGRLAKRGYVVVNATYRTIPDFKYPAPEDDAREALRWMRAQAGELGIDLERVAVFGYSAGGYLASLVALKDDAPERERVKAIVAGGAPSDLIFYAMGDLVPDYLGGRLYEVPERFYEASPANFVRRGSPPIFMYHGENDILVKPEHPWLMADAYRHAGKRAEVRWMPGRGHIAAFVFSREVVDEAIDFLDREVKGGG